jgi:acyl carrier protein
VRAAGYIANNEDSVQVLENCIASIRDGGNLIVFPEGTRTPADGGITLKRGAANIAVRTPCNITPVRIRCTPPMLVKGEKWWRLPAYRSHFHFDVMEDIDIQPFLANSFGQALAARQLTGHLRKIFFLRRFAMLTTEDDIKRLIVDVLQLEDTTPADIDVEAPLFGDGLGLDSIDALELGVAIQRRYGVALSANSEENRRHFASVRALASMVDNHRKNGDG